MPKIKAVIFDFGRVISAQKPVSLFRAYESDLGLTPGTINQIMFESQAWRDALVGRISATEFWYAVGPALGLDSQRRIDEFRRRYQADESINSGVLNMIRKLHEDYKLAVLSNNPPGLTDWLSDWEILDLFDVVFCSGDEGMAKPDPAVYSVTLKRLETLPHEAIFIDDTIGHVKTAQSLGMLGILFTESELLRRELNRLLTLHNKAQTKQDPILG